VSAGRITTGMLQRNILADLNRQTSRLSHTQGKLSSGKEITRPSDDPAGASKALLLREGLRGTQQHQRNATDGVALADATETALSSMSDLVQTARELVVQAGNDSYDATSRASIGVQIRQIADALKEQANTTYAGKHIFAGTKTDTAPYGTADDSYQGNTDNIAREIGPGVSVNINTTADAILGGGQSAGDDKLLDTLRDIADHLTAADGDSLRGTDLTRIDANLDNLSKVRAANGALTNRLESAQSRLASLEELSTKSLSDVEDADMAKTLIDFNTQSTAYQAALKAGANIVQSSLMDFLR
jgi:flagellar hook-associated protein 3 FlgL